MCFNAKMVVICTSCQFRFTKYVKDNYGSALSLSTIMAKANAPTYYYTRRQGSSRSRAGRVKLYMVLFLRCFCQFRFPGFGFAR
nr:hypothetical protein HmN_001021100 [Hymenolepis microstoma]